MALRRRDPRRGPQPAHRRPRGPRAGRWSRRHGEWNNDLVAIDLATGDVSVARRGRGLLRRAAALARRLDPRLARVAPPEHALGRHRAAARARGGRRRPRSRRDVAGSRRDWISQPRWSPDGVLHFAAEPHGLDEPLPLRRRAGSSTITDLEAEFVGPDWQFGYTTYEFLPDGDILAIAPLGRPRPARPVEPGRRRSTPIDLPYTEIGWPVDRRRPIVDPARGRPGAARRRSPSSTSTGNVDGPPPGDARPCPSPRTSRSRSTSSSRRPAAARPTATSTRRPTASFVGPGRRAAAAHRHQPRRPDGAGVLRLRDRHPAVHEPRLRGARRRLRRLDRLRPGLPQAARGPVGDRRRRRLRRRRAVPRRAGPRRRRAPGDPRRQRERLHDARRAGVHRRSSTPAARTSGSATCGRS